MNSQDALNLCVLPFGLIMFLIGWALGRMHERSKPQPPKGAGGGR